MKKRDTLVYILTIFLSFLYIFFGNKAANANKKEYTLNYETGKPQKVKVTKIVDDAYEKVMYPDFETSDRVVLFEARFTGGYRKGTVVRVIQMMDSMYAGEQRAVAVGDKVIIQNNQYTDAADVKYMYAGLYRVDFVIFLYVAFAVLLVLMGRRQGVNTLISLSFTVASIFCVFIPAVLNGGNIYAWSVSTGIFITVVPLLINNGASKKSLAAIIGCSAGVCVAGILTIITNEVCYITGLTTEDSMYLLLMNPDKPIDLKAVIFAAIIFGAVGAVMDVAMSLASSLAELKEQAGSMTAKQITRSGMVIGRDIMGTMTDTLILAYIGSSLSVTLLLVAYNSNVPMLLFNSEMIMVELLQAVAGSLGILLTIPLTSLVCGILYRAEDKENGKIS